jgi:small subunit ribosomal protein S1
MNPKSDSRLRSLRAELDLALRDSAERPAPTGATADPEGAEARAYRAVVAGVSGEDVVVELSPRVQGAVPRAELDAVPPPGTPLTVTLVGREEGLWIFSVREAKQLAAWDELEVGALVKGTVYGLNKGGLELKIGPSRAFMPASQVALEHVEDLAAYANQTLVCEVLEIDRDKRRVVVSRRAVLERERKTTRASATERLSVNAVVKGRVSRLESYGAFIDLGGVEGLLHVSNLAHRRVGHPEELLKLGQELEVVIISIEEGGKRIGLSRKLLEPDPWDSVPERYRPDQVLQGKVRRLMNFGAFLELEPGIEGLLHVSQLGGRARDPGQVLKIGEDVTVRIQSVDPHQKRISLTRLAPNGALLGSDEAAADAEVQQVLGEQPSAPVSTLGALLRKALEKGR